MVRGGNTPACLQSRGQRSAAARGQARALHGAARRRLPIASRTIARAGISATPFMQQRAQDAGEPGRQHFLGQPPMTGRRSTARSIDQPHAGPPQRRSDATTTSDQQRQQQEQPVVLHEVARRDQELGRGRQRRAALLEHRHELRQHLGQQQRDRADHRDEQHRRDRSAPRSRSRPAPAAGPAGRRSAPGSAPGCRRPRPPAPGRHASAESWPGSAPSRPTTGCRRAPRRAAR